MGKISEGKKAVATKDIPSSSGMLYKKSKVTVMEMKCSCSHGKQNIRVEDASGRSFWVGNEDILIL
jgi:hypothetical protein